MPYLSPYLSLCGGFPLAGVCRVSGAKNAVLPILAACVLTKKPVRLLDVPQLTDVDNMLRILQLLGCKVIRESGMLCIDAADAACCELPEDLSKELRSSIFLLGPVLGRFRRAVVTYPGGCEIGNRPIDLHLKGLAAMQAKIFEEGGRIRCDGQNLVGTAIHLDYPSVGATENIMMAATAASGETVIRNAAREPEIVDLQDFLLAAGFDVQGAGSSTIVIRGGCEPREVLFRIMPDRITAGTVLTAAAITGGCVTVENTVSEHLSGTLAKLTEAGSRIRIYDHAVEICAPKRPKAVARIETLPHPGFPTDMQSLMCALLCRADGTSVIVENVFENRFKIIPELRRMGADILQRDRTAIIHGTETLYGTDVTAYDLRGGAALVLAGLAAEGTTTVRRIEYIDRGYESIETLFSALGAKIQRISDTEEHHGKEGPKTGKTE